VTGNPVADSRPTDNPVVRRLQLLTTGWGYNFYDDRNQARADDLLIRHKVCHRLGEAARSLSALEVAYRQGYIPPATREEPFPPAEAMERLRAIGRLKAQVQDLSVRLRGAAVPTQDKVWFRLRQERTLLLQLLSYDEGMIAGADRIAELARDLTPERWDADAPGCAAGFDEPLQEIGEALRARSDLLLMPTL
jgi:hypothetical protein